ncbi:hypothetical protein KRX19_05555 [Cardiobacteriaceae bacterium TAE3-ERU3]|nr:hypothetical protein [Cardiobacteriaceae bacterium TAE3-ERU3]
MAGSEYLLSKGTSIEMSKAEVTDMSSGESGADFQSLDTLTKSISWSGIESDEIDVTTLASADFKEFAVGMKDPGNLTIAGHYVPKSEAYKEIIKANKDGLRRMFRITFPDGAKFKVLGTVRSRSFEVSVADVMSGSLTIRLSGTPTESDS